MAGRQVSMYVAALQRDFHAGPVGSWSVFYTRFYCDFYYDSGIMIDTDRLQIDVSRSQLD